MDKARMESVVFRGNVGYSCEGPDTCEHISTTKLEEKAMKTPITTSIHICSMRILRLALLISFVMSVPLLAVAGDAESAHGHAAPAKLVQLVREATRQFIDVNAATAAGYGPFLGCVSGPEHGAMGVHYVNLALYGDGEIDASRPEALIYEPSNGRMRLLGVEFIVDAQTWLTNHNNIPPVLEGQVFQLIVSPNRYNLPSFFELHVWAWRNNPQGAFVDWNNNVTCEGQ
jgi:hypothetical protein